MSVTRITKFEAQAGMADQLHAFLRSLLPLIEQSQDCESCQLLQNQENGNEFIVIEVWASVSAHQASVKDIPTEKIGAVMPLLAGPPSGNYYAA